MSEFECKTCGHQSEEQFDGHNCLSILKDKVEELEFKLRGDTAVVDWLSASERDVGIYTTLDEYGVEECKLIWKEDDAPVEVNGNNLRDAVHEAMAAKTDETGEGMWS